MSSGILDSRKLRYFVAVVENRSFANAAAMLNITQPALSIAIKKLEQEVNAQLLDRSVTPLSPTIYGKAVYQSAKSIMSENARLQRELYDVADLNNGSVSIIISATFPYQLILETHRYIRTTYPNFAMVIEMGGYTANLNDLLDGKYDLIFSQLPASRSDMRLNHKQVMQDSFRVICSANHPLAKIKDLAAADLIEYPWVSGGPLNEFLPGWNSLFLEQGLVPPSAAISTFTLSITYNLLLNHDYLAMLPVKSVEPEISAGSLVTLGIPKLHWDQIKGISWARNRSMPPSVSFFLDSFLATQKAHLDLA